MSAITEIIMRLFLICLAAGLSTSASTLLGPQHYLLAQGPPKAARTANHQPTNYDNCYCPIFHANSVQVSSVVGDNPADIERVVVYFYKNKLTNKLVMYTPSKEKQQQIPDLPYDAGDDLLTIGTETVVQLYENTLHAMSEQHDNVNTPRATNQHRLIDYISNSGSVMNPAAAVEFTGQHSLYAMDRPKPYLRQQGNYENHHSNSNLHYNKEVEIESPYGIVPGNINVPTRHNVQYETNHNSHKAEQDSHNFNHWFEEQLKQLPELSDSNNEFIDIHALKTRIANILRDHDINIVDNHVQDVLGNNFDMTNLQLLQITIDEQVPNIRGEWSPVHVEGMMLVHLNPLHVLGVIPLKKSHFLTSFHSTSHRIIPGKTSTATGIHGSNVNGNNIYDSNVHDSNVHGSNAHGSDVHNTFGSLLDLLGQDQSKFLVSSQSQDNSPEASENVFDNDDKSHENSKVARPLKEENTTQVYELVKDLVKTFGKYFNPGMISDVVQHLLDNPNSRRAQDGPEFRIIGGNPALNSGTPLNNKARSGYVEALKHLGH